MQSIVPQVLVIEDDTAFAAMLDYNLVACNFAVEWFNCGAGASKRLSRAPYPDLVLLDLKLPGMSGLELLRRMRCVPETRTVPVIVMTCHSKPGDREFVCTAGATDFVAKGAPILALLSRIRCLLEPMERRTTFPWGQPPRVTSWEQQSE